MYLSEFDKNKIKKEIIFSLKSQNEIEKLIIFGSFLNDENPNDIDLAIIQNADEDYLTLALKYRKMLRNISKKIPIDVIPIKSESKSDFVIGEIESGEIIYEKIN